MGDFDLSGIELRVNNGFDIQEPARTWARRMLFLIWRPLISKCLKSATLIPGMLAALRRLVQIFSVYPKVSSRSLQRRSVSLPLESLSKSLYLSATEILLWKAGSNDLTLLVVKNKTPWWYSNNRKKIPTMAFRLISCSVLLSKKISAHRELVGNWRKLIISSVQIFVLL